jgi:hypothetical protein
MVGNVSIVKNDEDSLEASDESLSKVDWINAKWKQWEESLIKTRPCPITEDVISSLPPIIIDPVGGGEMTKEGGMWKNQITGSVFLCKNLLFELVEDSLEPICTQVLEPIRMSPASGKPMLKYRSKKLPGIYFDKCVESGGFYFDPSELTKLKTLEFGRDLADNEVYEEYRQGYLMSRSKHRWNGFGAAILPGVDTLATFIKFRTALFFNSPLGAGISLKSYWWLSWLLSLPNNKGLNFSTDDKTFDSIFLITANNKALAKLLLDEEVRSAILELSTVSFYGECAEIELTDAYISVSEGPYIDSQSILLETSSQETPLAWHSCVGCFDKSEDLVAKLVVVASMLEKKLS